MIAPTQLFRATLAAVALGALALTAGHAAARNHDTQTFRAPATGWTLHDRAPGPANRSPNRVSVP